uniref:Uncharacterized protein n=1 Tax=Plectus sambesii TaxID=2011161 RepID=A0A914WRX8_9BILA
MPPPPPAQPSLPTYRLIYYRGRGRAEAIRYMLVLSGKGFDDCRISISQWKTIKEREGLGEDSKLPVLEIDNKELIIGAANIGRHLANEFGFYGKSDKERAEIDEILEEIEAMYPNLTPVVRAALGKNDRQKRASWEAYKESTLTAALTSFSKRLGQNRFFVGGNLTWADLAVAEMLTRFEQCYEGSCLRDWGT